MAVIEHVPVPGGSLLLARHGHGPTVVLAVHGIAGSHESWRAVARHLPEDGFTVVAPDLRGRGGSWGLPGPYGVSAHVDDLRSVLDHLGAPEVVVAGHSMGATIAVHLALAAPGTVQGLVLVDGGLPLPLPAGLPPQDVMEATIQPTEARLAVAHPDAASLLETLWAMPPFAGRAGDPDVAALFAHEQGGDPPAVRSRIDPAAIRREAEDLFTVDQIRTGAARLGPLRLPVHLLLADHGLRGEPGALYPTTDVEEYVPTPVGSFETVPDTNHFTILLDPAAQSVAASVQKIATQPRNP